MPQSRPGAAGTRWQEWTIVLCILALTAIGVASIWGGAIRQWIDSSGERSGPAKPDQAGGAAGPRL